jgi:4-amino-4-deoxy-L-arabinose transferase-like glycosyltransferase
LLFILLAGHAARVETPTVDEFAHLPAGCAYWEHGRTDLYAKNPPLLKYVLAIPAIVDSRTVTPKVEVEPLGWGPWQYGARFMNANRDRYFDIFFCARIINIILALATGIVLYFWSRELFGEFSAAVVVSLFFLSPTVLAHSHLATLDVGCMFGVLVSIFTVRWAYKKPSARRLVLSGFVLALALLTKFTAILLVPVVAVLMVIYRLPSRPKIREWVAEGALVFLTALFVTNLAMGFDGSFGLLGDYELHAASSRTFQKFLPGWLPVPLPGDYVYGLDAQRLDTEAGEFPSYLMGQWSKEGWWTYNLVTLGLKVPVPLLAMFLAAPWFWRRAETASRETWAVVLPVATLLIVLSGRPVRPNS